jgi:hypothetical protein
LAATVRDLTDDLGHSTIHGPFSDAAQRLRLDAATAEVLRAFAAAGVDARLLKGRTFLAWLYEDGGRRPYLDVDLLVRPGDEAAADEVLGRLGFVRRWDQSQLPGWWQEHGSEWLRATDAVLVDLHRNLAGIGADPTTAWAVLADPAPTVAVGGYDAPALAIPARVLHVSLHAAQHGSGFGKGLDDLEKALQVVPETTWKEASALAARVDAVDAFGAGLRLKPEGAALADRLGLAEPASVEVRLRTQTAPPVALGIEQLALAGSWRARADILARKLVPPQEFMRHWDPRAAEGRGRLVLAYLRRPFWLMRHAPAGVRAWWRVRRRARR